MVFYKHYKKHTPYGITEEDLAKLANQSNSSCFFEGKPCGKFVCVYLLDKKNKHAFVYDTDQSVSEDFKSNLITSELHKEAHEKAFKGQEVIYEWHAGEKSDLLYQSIALPLEGKDKEGNYVLGLVRVINTAAPLNGGALQVAEGMPVGSLPQMIIRAREEEKRKLTSILHDELGSSALFMNSLLSLLKEDIKEGKKKEALTSIDNLGKAINDYTDRMKKIIVTLRPPQLADIGLNSAVKELIENMAEASGLNITYKYELPEKLKMPEVTKITLYRVVQEALNNTIKHANAKNVDIHFAEEGNKILLTVKDDGKGFVQDKHRSIQKLGLLGMRESIAYLGGVLDIKSDKGAGTEIKAECPKISYARNL